MDKTEKKKSTSASVRIFNMSAKVLTIKPRSDICELHEVKVLRHADPESPENKTKQEKK